MVISAKHLSLSSGSAEREKKNFLVGIQLSCKLTTAEFAKKCVIYNDFIYDVSQFEETPCLWSNL